MTRFEKGDRVKTPGGYYGEIYNIDYAKELIFITHDCDKTSGSYIEYQLTKIGGSTMSKYTELKSRIEALNNGWDKDADSILDEIHIKSSEKYVLWIPFVNDGVIHIYDWNKNTDLRGSSEDSFPYHSQYSKMTAFKEALMWLLNNSSIKKDARQEKLDALTEKLEDIQAQINELKED